MMGTFTIRNSTISFSNSNEPKFTTSIRGIESNSGFLQCSCNSLIISIVLLGLKKFKASCSKSNFRINLFAFVTDYIFYLKSICRLARRSTDIVNVSTAFKYNLYKFGIAFFDRRPQ